MLTLNWSDRNAFLPVTFSLGLINLRASENLLDVLLGIRPKDVNVVVQES